MTMLSYVYYIVTIWCLKYSLSISIYQTNHENLIDNFHSELIPLQSEYWNYVSQSDPKQDVHQVAQTILNKMQSITSEMNNVWPFEIESDLGNIKHLIRDQNFLDNALILNGYFDILHGTTGIEQLEKPEHKAYLQFAQHIIEPPNSEVMKALKDIQNFYSKDVYGTVKKEMEKKNCHSSDLVNQVIHFLYILVNLLNLKGNLLIQFANLMTNLYKEYPEAKMDLSTTPSKITNTLLPMAGNSSALIWNCNPNLGKQKNINDICDQASRPNQNVKCIISASTEEDDNNKMATAICKDENKLIETFQRWSLPRCSYCVCFSIEENIKPKINPNILFLGKGGKNINIATDENKIKQEENQINIKQNDLMKKILKGAQVGFQNSISEEADFSSSDSSDNDLFGFHQGRLVKRSPMNQQEDDPPKKSKPRITIRYNGGKPLKSRKTEKQAPKEEDTSDEGSAEPDFLNQ